MATLKNLIGKRYGKLLVTSYAGKNDKALHIWNCLCDCGNLTIGTSANLGRRKNSCGCLIGKKSIHGMRDTKTYKSWSGMKQRVSNPRILVWKYYGGRGITVCDKWLTFSGFLEDMGVAKEGESIERIDPDGNYEKDNCRWATKIEQARNKRNNILIKQNNKTQCLSEWAKLYGLKVATLWARYDKGYKPPELFLPVGEIPRGGASHLSQQANNRMIDGSHR